MTALHILPTAAACLVVLALGALDCHAAANALANPFFAMDTGLRDGRNTAPAQRAETLAALGFAGSDLTGNKAAAETLKAYDAKGVRLFATYNWLQVDPLWQPDDGIKQAIEALKGRQGFIWVAMGNKKYKPSDPAGDDEALPMLRRLADLAAPKGVRVAIYPHTDAWVERVEDTIRLARKCHRDNVGGTFNLCHFLQVDGETSKLPALLKDSRDKLFAVTISGADAGAKGWDRLIQPLGRGTFDMDRFLRTLSGAGYKGPVGLQSYGIKGDSRAILGESISAWNSLKVQALCPRVDLIGGDLSAFRGETGDWLIAADAMLDPKNENRLTWTAGAGVTVNGPKGGTGHLVTKAEHGDCRAHVEFMVPKGSNSGVYFQGRYEIQILDSWGVKAPGSGDCGGIYERWKDDKGYEGRPPRVNASLPPGQWQTYDVWFRAPRFDGAGRKIADARFVKVIHNGKVIHENQPVTGPTRAAMFEQDEKPLGPLMLQGDHGPVAYRNCWIVTGDIPAPSGPNPDAPPAKAAKVAGK
jgi:sugar phosphate isomerase/epimerase